MTPEQHDYGSGLPPDITGTVATVGTFDGVHRGHQDVLARLVDRARVTGLPSLLVTFDPHPLEVVNPAAAPPLLTLAWEKLEVIAESGIEYLAIVPFTPTLQRYTAEQFVDLVLVERYRVRELLIGYDHGIGRGREGDADVLRTLGAERGFAVEVIEAVTLPEGRPISSTTIRRAVAGGDLVRAAQGLGRPYSVGGRVVPGAQRGRVLGYPTLNLEPVSPRKLLPPEGVYAVRVQTPAGPFGGMMNLGPRPTFDDSTVTLEAHLFDARSDLYGAWVRVEFVARLRDTRRFPGAEALRAQLALDAQQARRALTLMEHSGNLHGSPASVSSFP
ncbi:MAG TPA: bifunctional riboflavin kinase/FAD synthetase [Gemmatimonadaceae bacterium]|nr:bifunctional riboflavin kinase/FAD synthetase [Gemmatimonadaceae bacterium]